MGNSKAVGTRYVFFIGVCLLTGVLGSLATSSEIQGWYSHIQKPDWTPPSWLFGPVWSCLYIMMGIAAARVWGKRKEQPVTGAMVCFAVQLFLNGAWSFIFFGFHRPDLALVEILLLLAMILLTLRAFSRIDRIAGWLLVPYLAWVSFAACLNTAIYWLNQGLT